MRSIKAIEDLNIPPKYRNYISQFLKNISDIPFISRVILFGSCAKETVKSRSDIDIFITTVNTITEDEEFLITFDRLPPYSTDSISMDIIVQPELVYNKYKDTACMIQKQINYYGVDLSGLLQ